MIAFLDVFLAYWIFLGALLVVAILGISLRKEIAQWIRQTTLTRKDWLILSLLFIITTTALVEFVPFRPRTQSDESLYLAMAQNMSHNNMSGMCEEALYTQHGLDCIVEGHTFKGKLWSFVLSAVLPYFTEPASAVHVLQLLLWFLAWLFLFLSISSWTKKPLLALFSCALLFSQPLTLQVFASGGNEPIYLTLWFLSLYILRWVYDSPSTKNIALLGIILAFWFQTRQETFVDLPAFLFVLALAKPIRQSPRLIFSFSIPFLIVFSPMILNLIHFHNFDLQSGNIPVRGHFIENILIASHRIFFPPYEQWFILLGILSAIVLATKAIRAKEYRGLLLFLALSLLPAATIFEHISGDMSIDSNHRYAVTWFPVLAFCFAWGITQFRFWITAKSWLTSLASISIVILSLGMGYKALVYDFPYATQDILREQRAFRDFLAKNPDARKALFIYTRPSHFSGDGVSSIYVGSVARPDNTIYLEAIKKWTGIKYFVWGYECQGKATSHAKIQLIELRPICEEALSHLTIEPVAESSGGITLFKISSIRNSSEHL